MYVMTVRYELWILMVISTANHLKKFKIKKTYFAKLLISHRF